MANTIQEINALIDRLYPDNMTGEISPLDGRTVTKGLALFTDNVRIMVQANTDNATAALSQVGTLQTMFDALIAPVTGRLALTETVANRADAATGALNDRIDGIIDMASGLTPEQVETARLERLDNTNFRVAQGPINQGFTSAIAALQADLNPIPGTVSVALARANEAFALATTAEENAQRAISNDGETRSALSTLEREKVDVNAAAILTLEGQIGLIGAVGEPGTGIRGDVKALQAADVTILGRLDALAQGGSGSEDDFRTAHGTTDAITPGTAYRGTGDSDYFDANKDTIPGLLQNRATGEFVIPAVSLTADDGTAIPAGTVFNLSGGFINPGLTGRTVGFNPIMYYVIEQGTSRLVGQGDVGSAGTDQEVARDWAVTDSIDNITNIGTAHAVTGAPIIVRWIAIYNGEDATLVPSLSAFNVSFTGRYEPLVEQIIHDVVDTQFTALKNQDRLNEGGIAANAVGVARVEGKADSNTVMINGVRTRLALPQYQAVENSSVVPVDTVTVDPTPLNNTLGGGSALAKQLDGAIDTATKFTTAFTDASQVLYLGDGQIARVVDGQFTVYELIEAQEPRTDTSEVRYITTPQGLGTRARPAVLEFGISVPGQTARAARDSELYLDTGIPTAAANETISNVSMAFAIRTNDNWASIPQTLQFSLRTGEVRTLPIPSPIVEMTMTATALADGRIHCTATHNRGVGNSQEVVTNGGAIRFDAGYTVDTAVARVARGQRTITVGPFRGDEVITVDTVRAGDSDTDTAKVILADRTLNTGYFLRDADRVNFAMRNNMHGFNFFSSEPSDNITPAVLAQLDGSDRYLGLFARNNHHGDALQFASGVIVPTSDGTETYNVGDALKRLGDIPTGTGLSETKAREIAQEIVNNSPAIQANTAKVGISTAQASAITANTAKPTEARVTTLANAAITAGLQSGGAIANYVRDNAPTGGLDASAVDTRADARIAASPIIAANTAKTGITSDQADDIVRNNNKISFLPENSLALDNVIASAKGHDTLFGGRLIGEYPANDDFEDSNGDVIALNMGDLVTQNGVTYQALDDITSATSSAGPGAGQSPDDYRVWDLQTMPYDDTGIVEMVNGRTTPQAAKTIAETAINVALEAGGAIATYVTDNAGSGGGTLTDQQIRDAIAGSPVAAPYNYKLKFASDTVNQVALPFLAGYDALKSFSTVGLVVDAPERTETEMVIPLVNQSVPNNVLADIPFQTMPEGTITVNTENNGALYIRGILRTTHNAGDAGNEFVVDRTTEIRTVNNGAVIFNFADFFSSVELSDAILARFPSGDTQQLKLDFVIQLFTDPALTQQRMRSQQTNLFTVQVNDIGLTFLQAAPIIGRDGESPEYQGSFNPATSYSKGDIVHLNSGPLQGSFISRIDGNNTSPLTAPQNWGVIAIDGTQGEPGAKGVDGIGSMLIGDWDRPSANLEDFAIDRVLSSGQSRTDANGNLVALLRGDLSRNGDAIYVALRDIENSTREFNPAAIPDAYQLWVQDGAKGDQGIQGEPGTNGKDGVVVGIPASLDDEGFCVVTSEDSIPTERNVAFNPLNLVCTDPALPITGRGFLTGLLTITADTVFEVNSLQLRDTNGVRTSLLRRNGDFRLVSGEGTTRQTFELGDPTEIGSGVAWTFGGTGTGSLNATVTGATQSSGDFKGQLSVSGTQGVLRDRAIQIAQRYGASGNQLLEISDTESIPLDLDAGLSPAPHSTETIVPLPLPALIGAHTLHELRLSVILFGAGAIRVFYSDDNEAITAITEQGAQERDIGVVDITRPISVGLLGSPVVGISSGTLTGTSFGTLHAQDIINAQGVVDSNLEPGGAIAQYVADNAPAVEPGVSLEAVANEMRADGDIATIPAETQPATAQITATAEAQTDITVPDNALFRSLSTVNASFSSNIINTGNAINVGIRYTDDDTVAPTGGLRPAFTNSTIRNFTGIDLTRPIAFFFGMGEIQTITVADVSFTNTKTGTGSLVDEMQTVILNQVAGDITLGGDPVMGGGARYRTFYRDLTSAQLGAGSTQTFALPSDVVDEEVTYVTWAAMVLTASTTASNATLWGGDSGAGVSERGSVSLNLQQRGSGGAHSFGIGRQSHGNAVRIGTRTGTPSSGTVVRVSVTIRQGALLKLPAE